MSEGKNWREQIKRDDGKAIEEGLAELTPEQQELIDTGEVRTLDMGEARLGFVNGKPPAGVRWNGMDEEPPPEG